MEAQAPKMRVGAICFRWHMCNKNRAKTNPKQVLFCAESNRLLRNISVNINQIAARANAMGSIYAADMEEIKTRQGEIWERQDKIIRALGKIVEVE